MNDSSNYYNNLIDNYAIHPGVFVKDELDARGWTHGILAEKSGCPELLIDRIVSRKENLTAPIVTAISDAFGVSEDLLRNAQKSYDLAIAKQRRPADRELERALSAYPIKEMIERGWIKETRQKFIDMQMFRFFEASEKDQIPHSSAAFAAKKTDYSKTSLAQIAWLYRVRHIARQIDAPNYSKQALNDALPKLRDLLCEPDDVQYIPDILLTCGVRLVVVETLKNANICGATCWLSKNEPVIGLTTRHDQFDNFWFVLRHEIEHVLRGHGMDTPLLDGDIELSLTDELEKREKVANNASQAFGIEPQEFEKFMEARSKSLKSKDIRDFAKEQQVHPGIVAGLVRRHLNKWNLFEEFNVKIRSQLTKKLVYDGWGEVVQVEL